MRTINLIDRKIPGDGWFALSNKSLGFYCRLLQFTFHWGLAGKNEGGPTRRMLHVIVERIGMFTIDTHGASAYRFGANGERRLVLLVNKDPWAHLYQMGRVA